MPLTLEDFSADPHATTYLSELSVHPAAAESLLDLLNEPTNELKMIHAEGLGKPALTGVASLIEADAAIAAVLGTGSAGFRFRQAVGVAIRLKMEQMGWRTTGRKGAVPTAHYFTKAEHYTL